MTGLRQAYTYSMAFVTLLGLAAGAQTILAVWAASLLGRVTDPRQAWQAASAGIALVVVAGPVWLAHYLWGKRMAARIRVDRSSLPRILYLSGAMLVSLVGVALSAVGALSYALALRFAEVPPWAIAGFTVWGVVWLVHRRVEEESEAVEPAARHNAVQSTYIHVVSAGGLVAFVAGLVLALGTVPYLLASYDCVELVTDRLTLGMCLKPFKGAGQAVALGVALAVVGLAVWLPHWARARRENPSSRIRVTYLYLVTLLLGGVTLGALAAAAGLAVLGLTGAPVAGVKRPLLLAVALIPALTAGGALWSFHQRLVFQDARQGAWRMRHALPTMRYLTAGVAVTLMAIGLWGGFTYFISLLAPWDGGEGLLRWRRWAGPMAVLAVLGGVPWAYLVVRSRPGGRERFQEELRLVPRRAYLYAVLAGGVVTLVAGLAWLVAGLLSDIGDGALDRRSVARLAPQAAAAVVGALAAAAHGVWLRQDLRRCSDRTPMGRLVVLVVPDGDIDIARRVEEALGTRVEVLLTATRVGPGVAMTDEQLDRIVRAVREGGSDKYLVLLVGQWPEVHPLR